MKTLKIKRVFAYTIYNNLRNTPPKDYPTTGEIKSTIGQILPAFKTNIEDYLTVVKEAEALNIKKNAKEITEADYTKAIEEINTKFKAYGKEHNDDVVEIKLENEDFTILKTQFDRENWGKGWVANIEEFVDLDKAFTAAGKEEAAK